MGFKSIEWAFDQELPSSEKLLLVALAKCMNDETGDCFPSYDTLRLMTGMKRNTIAKCVKNLESKNLVSRRKRFGSSVVYELASSIQKGTSTEKDTNDTSSIQNGTSAEKGTVSSIQKGTRSSIQKGTVKGIEKEIKRNKEDSYSLTPVPAKRTRKVEPTHAFNLASIPEDWKTYCIELCGSKVDPDTEFKKLKRWASTGKVLRTDKGWARTWDNWIARALTRANENPSYKPKASVNPFEQAARREAIRKIQEAQEEREAQDIFGSIA